MNILRTGLYIRRFIDAFRRDENRRLLLPLPNPFISILRLFGLYDAEKNLVKELCSTKENYRRTLQRIKEKYSQGKPIKVMFIATCAAKWKLQSLYDLMVADEMFEPVVGVSYICRYNGETPRSLYAGTESLRMYLEGKGCRCVYICDPLRNKFLDISGFDVDLVIYTESWYYAAQHHPRIVSKMALTCYIPYYVPNYVDTKLDCGLMIHKFYWKYVVINEGVCEIYRKYLGAKAGVVEFAPLGHPMLDCLYLGKNNARRDRRKTIIYAPHWTFYHPNHITQMSISTFAELGKVILEYAQSHPEFNWIFKPHPNLYPDLISTGMMTQYEANAYYEAWRKLGQAYEGGDYMPLFCSSYAMITDCGSFLSEYGATEKPIIHLISHRNKMVPPRPLYDVFESYYKAHNIEEMYSIFKMVLEEGNDPLRDQRVAALRQAALCDKYSAKDIVEYFKMCFRG